MLVKIVGDIGNTETKICVVNSNKILKRFNIRTADVNYQVMDKKLKFLKDYSFKKSIFSSVVPSTFKKIRLYFKKKYNIKIFELKETKIQNFLNIKVNRKQVGSDRLANAISVCKKNKNYIIIDFGTATTFDVVVKKNYLGGIIAPGVNLSLQTLISNASLISKVNLSKVRLVIGKNTSSAVKSGFYWGYAGLIDNLIYLISKETKKKYSVILTGGLAHLFKSSIKVRSTIDKDLTIKGLIKLAN
mgnify:CR=1 FL=1